jgi:predicted XRE-type DNA-binding protein
MSKMTEEHRARLGDIATAWRDALDVAKVQRTKLQDAVLEAIDGQGASNAEVAAVLGVSRTRVYEIVACAYKDR